MSQLSKLLGAVDSMTMESSMSRISTDSNFKPIDSEVNRLKLKNLVNGVFKLTVDSFRGVDESQHKDLIKEYMQNHEVLSLAARQGIVNDADAVTILEALKFTSETVIAERNNTLLPVVRMALIEPSEITGQNPEAATKQPIIWNAIVSSDFSGTEYTELYEAAGQGPKKLNVLGISLDTYEIRE